jgi:hypothetical protein
LRIDVGDGGGWMKVSDVIVNGLKVVYGYGDYVVMISRDEFG